MIANVRSLVLAVSSLVTRGERFGFAAATLILEGKENGLITDDFLRGGLYVEVFRSGLGRSLTLSRFRIRSLYMWVCLSVCMCVSLLTWTYCCLNIYPSYYHFGL
jgi:hypothetical protein